MKRSNNSAATSYVLLVFSQLLVLAAAMCSKYTPSSDINYQLNRPTRDLDFHIGQMSPVLNCPADPPKGGYDCAHPGSFKGSGCVLKMKALIGSSGFITGQGSLLASPEEKDNVFSLVRDAMIGGSPKQLWIFQYAAGCVEPNNIDTNFFTQCVQRGKSAYIDGTRLTYCTNGTLSGCDKDGNFQDGHPIRVCGPRKINGPHNPNPIIQLEATLAYVNASEAAQRKTYPAFNEKSKNQCKAIEKKASAAGSIMSSVLLSTAAATLTTGFVLFGW